jgi:hypothetical protein
MKALYYNDSYKISPQRTANPPVEKSTNNLMKIIDTNDYTVFDSDLQQTQIYLDKDSDSFDQDSLRTILKPGATLKNEQFKH